MRLIHEIAPESDISSRHPVTDDFHDAPDGAVIEWPEFGPGLWARHGDEWVPAR
jgi:hypothetical protein